MHKWNMFKRTAPIVLSLVVAAVSAPSAAFAADDFGDGVVVEAAAEETAPEEVFAGEAEETAETAAEAVEMAEADAEAAAESETEVSVIAEDEAVVEAADGTEEGEVIVEAEEAEETIAEDSAEIIFDAGEETAAADIAFADADNTVKIAGVTYAWTTTAADGYTQIDSTGVYYKATEGTEPGTSDVYYGTATLTYKEFYTGDVSDTSTAQYDTYASATTKKYSTLKNAAYTFNNGTDSTDGYKLTGVQNVPVQVSAQTYVKAAILKAAGTTLSGAYAEAAEITVADSSYSTKPSYYKVLGTDGSYSTATDVTVTTITDATAEIEAPSYWGDYVLVVTDGATKYLRNTRSDDGFAINSTVLGAVIKGTDASGNAVSFGLRHLSEIWVQPYEVAFSKDVAPQKGKITEIDYITTTGVYKYDLSASSPYVKEQIPAETSANLKASLIDGNTTQISVSGFGSFTNPKATVSYATSGGHHASLTYVLGSESAGAAFTVDANGAATLTLADSQTIKTGVTYTLTISSDNYPDWEINLLREGAVTVNGTTYNWKISYDTSVDGYTKIGDTNVFVKGSLPTGDFYGTAAFTYRDFYNGLVSSTDGTQYDTYASATSSKYEILANEDTTVNYEKNEDGTIKTTTQTNSKTGAEETVKVVNKDASGYYYYINGVKNVSVKVAADVYTTAAIMKDAGVLPESGVYTVASGITLNTDAAAAVAQYKALNADGTWAAMTLSTAATVTDATAVLETSSHWGDYVLEVTESSTKNIRNGRSDDGFAVNSNILGVIVKASDGTSVGLRHCYEIWVQPWEVAFSKDCGLQGKTVTEIDYIMPTGTYVYTFGSGVYVKDQLTDTVKNGVAASFAAYSDTEVEVTGLAAFTNPKLSVYWVEGSGKTATTTYLAEETAVTVKDGTATVTLSSAAEVGKEYTVKLASDNYADMTTTVTLASAPEAKEITVKKDVINLKYKKSTTLKPVLKGGLSGKITYTSSNKKVATVNSKGKITAKSKTGYTKITIKCGDYKKVVKVYVNEKLTLKKSSATIKVKGKTKIKATTNIKGTITYTSSNTKVAAVTKKGVVKGIKKGTATITVKCNGKTKKFKVTVK